MVSHVSHLLVHFLETCEATLTRLFHVQTLQSWRCTTQSRNKHVFHNQAKPKSRFEIKEMCSNFSLKSLANRRNNKQNIITLNLNIGLGQNRILLFFDDFKLFADQNAKPPKRNNHSMSCKDLPKTCPKQHDFSLLKWAF